MGFEPPSLGRYAPQNLSFSVFRYSYSASVSSRYISDSQSSMKTEHGSVIQHSLQRGAPHVPQYAAWSSEICFSQSVHLIILCSRFMTVLVPFR